MTEAAGIRGADWFAAGTSLAAFIVAVLAFYLGSVKRADVWLARVPTRPPNVRVNQSSQLPDGRIWPSSVSLEIPLIAANSGARAGVLTEVTLQRLEEDKPHPVLFIGYGPLPRMLETSMKELDGGSVREFRFEIPLPYSISLSMDPEENLAMLEAILESKEALNVKIGYSYLKGRSFLPGRRGKALIVHRELPFRVDMKSLLELTRVDGDRGSRP